MCGLIALLMVVLGGAFGYSAFTSLPLSTPPAEAPPVSCSVPSSREDIVNALNIGGDAFDPSLWTVEVTDGIHTYKTTVTWTSNQLGALAYLEYLHYDCGVTQAQIDAYYSPQNLDGVMLTSYSPHTQTGKCEANGVELLEYDGTLHDMTYHIDYWIEQTSPTRVAGLMLAIPASEQAKEDVYARQLFPDLPTCAG